MFKLPKDKQFREYGDMSVIGTTHGSLQVHIPAKAARELGIKKGDQMRCYANSDTKQVVFELLKEKKDDRKTD